VNGEAALSDSIASDTVPWHFALQADNADGGKYTFASIVGVVNPPGTNTPDLVSTASGSVYAPPQQETLTYDDDGNLVSDGRWQYTWNGENRLIKAEELVSPTNRLPNVVEYTYDHRGRMIWKTVASPTTPPVKAITYLWDDYNIITEAIAQDNATNTTYNIWGLDLDGILQGAGGVGGLLAVVKDSATYVPAWDANGNIIEYSADDGMIVAHREYDPFGGTIVATGDVDTFSHWFSTKPWCSVTGLCEYQYRKFSPVIGRWLVREPLGESECANLFVIVFNTLPNDIIDYLGAEPIKVGGACSIHGRGDEGQFDSIASSCSENWKAVSSGEEILSHLKTLTTTSKSCCISEYTIAGHGWRYRDDTKERDLGPGVPGGGTDNGFYQDKTGKQAGAIDISDLQKAIDAGEIKFCKPCSIQIYSCRVSPSFSASLAKTTGCAVIGAAGSCFMGGDGKWACGAKNSGEQAKGGYFGFYKCTPTGDMTFEGTTHEPF
jgi:RHS repeat-associated protein